MFTILIPLFYFGQKYCFTYEYSFKPDSLNLEKTETELMGLFIDGNESTYVSLTKLRRDSAIAQKMKGNGTSSNMSVSLSTFPKEKVPGIIQKNWPSNKVVSYQFVGVDGFKITQNIIHDWHITAETDEIEGKKCQLATIQYKGRMYNAWFTNEIPISEGPYKFSGLPGLIVKIEDTKKQHIWELKGIEKFRKIKFNFSKYIPVTEVQYKKSVENYIKDPMSKMRELKQRFDVIGLTVTSPDGNSYSGADYEKIRTKQIQANFKKNNNSIELD
ncbi:GLPGLI family protein [Chryseobacterium sp. H1D6B]|uniref:GLPGLI family protein n=1 Tax=Chryseobacterium sp. H1D6B TaxID=2940588 RepID=UPI0015CA2B84|nr:GLPGLI family protein [Chryseobacterium sp. H1D6B]